MTIQFPARVRAWLADAFYFDTPGQAADAMADATRWGWLPALSGVAAGADQVRRTHSETTPEPPELSA
ncbi:hypothetical protein QF038_003349 [Pseudarthrobacter sp. W1I19]|uniref:hypothetical protein n=1 Tax=Pseudarthrobacter sp. W1I19 TaxID=3042288 RepID=UPI00278B3E71|nr:hypothetical protein [Pseudarthrobacter sp. W1I19]MDQ0924841.1 hypothetical protein [Pseudarthrobacter sp. W1I19]